METTIYFYKHDKTINNASSLILPTYGFKIKPNNNTIIYSNLRNTFHTGDLTRGIYNFAKLSY